MFAITWRKSPVRGVLKSKSADCQVLREFSGPSNRPARGSTEASMGCSQRVGLARDRSLDLRAMDVERRGLPRSADWCRRRSRRTGCNSNTLHQATQGMVGIRPWLDVPGYLHIAFERAGASNPALRGVAGVLPANHRHTVRDRAAMGRRL